ncbi:MAG: oligoendopeptidase F [Acholeplasmatales bacterium]|nr:oligoendopeptidase F [Acholeplasmatales bacterium]
MNDWNLKLIYESEEAFEKDFNELSNDIKNILSLKGKLNNPEGLIQFSKVNRSIDSRVNNLYIYAAMAHDLNQKDLVASKRFQKVYSKYMEVIQAISFVDPELLKNKKEDLLGWCDTYPELKPLKFQFTNLYRLNKFVKTAKIEAIMANYNDSISGYTNLYDNLVVADNNPVKATLKDGSEVDVSMANYAYLLGTLKEQEDRRTVFEALYKYYDAHKKTLAQIYKGIMAGELAEVTNRGYKSILESKLYSNNIDKKVYTSLVSVARNYNQPLKRYYKLRKKYFGLKELHTYDRMLKFRTSSKVYSYEESKRLVLEADKELGEDFYNKAKEVMADGRVSVYPSDGKSTGAYSNSTYDKGTIIMLNHTDDLNSAFTLAHEAGHSIHSMYSIEAQPQETYNYTIFVAEVASTFNEARFLDYMMKNTTDKNERIVLLQEAIDGLVATFYRQTLFADYELQAHTLFEKGEVIDEEVLSNIMKDLYKKYYGIDLETEELKKFVWAYIPHLFHSPFYVYQYATSYATSQAIYMNVKNNVPGAFESYINLLKSGGLDYPVELIKKAGVDLTTKEPFMAVVKRLDELVTMLEKELYE